MNASKRLSTPTKILVAASAGILLSALTFLTGVILNYLFTPAVVHHYNGAVNTPLYIQALQPIALAWFAITTPILFAIGLAILKTK